MFRCCQDCSSTKNCHLSCWSSFKTGHYPPHWQPVSAYFRGLLPIDARIFKGSGHDLLLLLQGAQVRQEPASRGDASPIPDGTRPSVCYPQHTGKGRAGHGVDSQLVEPRASSEDRGLYPKVGPLDIRTLPQVPHATT